MPGVRIIDYKESVPASTGRGAPIASMTPPRTDGGQILAHGLSSLSSGLVNAAEAIDRSEEEQAKAWSASALSQARLDWTQGLLDRQATAEPGAPEFAPKLLGDFDEYAQKLIGTAPTKRAAGYLHGRMSEFRSDLGTKALEFEAKARVDYKTDNYNTGIQNTAKLMNTDPSQYQVALAEQLAVIDAASLPPIQKSALREKAINDISTAATWSMIQKSPTAFLEKIGFYGRKPEIQNPDGTVSTERTITVEMDGRHIVIPTIIDGKQRTNDEAVAAYRAGGNPSVGEFKTAAEADKFARDRSTAGGANPRVRTFSGDLKGKTGLTSFDALPFERRTQMFEQAIRLKAQNDSDVDRLAKVERDRISNEAMKNIWSLQSDNKLTRNYIELQRPVLSAEQYHSALRAIGEGANQKSDPSTFRQLQKLLYTDPVKAGEFAFTAHRNGLLSNEHLASAQERARSLDRSEGPKSPYERARAYIVTSMDPGPLVKDPIGKSRMADAVLEFDNWMNSGKHTDEEIQTRGQETVTRYKFIDMREQSLALPQPRVGRVDFGDGTDRKAIINSVTALGNQLRIQYDAKSISKFDYDNDMAILNRWQRLAKKP